jgi:hypothetical protein
MVFEAIGVNLLTLIRMYHPNGVPLALTKFITIQILIALDYIHTRLRLIHTDLKPENVLLEWPIVMSADRRNDLRGGYTFVDSVEQLLGKNHSSSTSTSSSSSSSSSASRLSSHSLSFSPTTPVISNPNVLSLSPTQFEQLYARKYRLYMERRREREEIASVLKDLEQDNIVSFCFDLSKKSSDIEPPPFSFTSNFLGTFRSPSVTSASPTIVQPTRTATSTVTTTSQFHPATLLQSPQYSSSSSSTVTTTSQFHPATLLQSPQYSSSSSVYMNPNMVLTSQNYTFTPFPIQHASLQSSSYQSVPVMQSAMKPNYDYNNISIHHHPLVSNSQISSVLNNNNNSYHHPPPPPPPHMNGPPNAPSFPPLLVTFPTYKPPPPSDLGKKQYNNIDPFNSTYPTFLENASMVKKPNYNNNPYSTVISNPNYNSSDINASNVATQVNVPGVSTQDSFNLIGINTSSSVGGTNFGAPGIVNIPGVNTSSFNSGVVSTSAINIGYNTSGIGSTGFSSFQMNMPAVCPSNFGVPCVGTSGVSTSGVSTTGINTSGVSTSGINTSSSISTKKLNPYVDPFIPRGNANQTLVDSPLKMNSNNISLSNYSSPSATTFPNPQPLYRLDIDKRGDAELCNNNNNVDGGCGCGYGGGGGYGSGGVVGGGNGYVGTVLSPAACSYCANGVGGGGNPCGSAMPSFPEPPPLPDCPYTLKYLKQVRVFKKYKVKLVDFGNSITDSNAEEIPNKIPPPKFGEFLSTCKETDVLYRPKVYPTHPPVQAPHRIQTRQYRSPEAIIGAHCSCRALSSSSLFCLLTCCCCCYSLLLF